MTTSHPDVDTALLVFAKSPRPGEVKTRLMPGLSAHQAASLHERMVDHVLGEARASRLGPVFLCCAPDTRCPRLQCLAKRHGAGLLAQVGEGLGPRMGRAIRQALESHRRVLLMGSDCPWLTAPILARAGRALDAPTSVVLIPAVDGGYVLVGSTRPCDAIFEDVPWGTPEVLAVTRRRLADAGLEWNELAPLRDVDRVQDLDLLPQSFRTRHIAPNF